MNKMTLQGMVLAACLGMISAQLWAEIKSSPAQVADSRTTTTLPTKHAMATVLPTTHADYRMEMSAPEKSQEANDESAAKNHLIKQDGYSRETLCCNGSRT